MTRLRAAGFLLLLTIPFWHDGARTVVATAQPFGGLRIENISVSSTPDLTSQDLTVTFQIVNNGAAIAAPFRTAVSVAHDGESHTDHIETRQLAAGQRVYASRTITVPAGGRAVDLRIEADLDDVGGGGGPVVAVGHFAFGPPVPGHWFSIGPRRVSAPPTATVGVYATVGRLGPIAVHPSNPQIIYVGSSGQLGHEGCGVWKTTNGGISWIPVTDGLPSLSIAAIAIDPTNPNRVYVAITDTGVFRSDDGGTSWIQTSTDVKVRRLKRNTADGDRTVLLVDPNNPLTLYLTSEFGVVRSNDAGATWNVSLSAGSATALVMDLFNSNKLYAAIQGKGVYKTTDGGVLGDSSWSLQPLPATSNFSPVHGIRLALSHPPIALHEIVYALVGSETDPNGYVLMRSIDGGASWNGRFRCDTSADECEFWVLSVDPSDSHVYLGGLPLWVSTNGGAGFDRVPLTGNDRLPASPHGDYHGFAINPINPSIVYAASDGGIFRSSDHGATDTWTFIGQGIANAEIYDLAQTPALSGRLIAGTQDNGTIEYNGSPTWDHIEPVPPNPFGGDGGIVAIDPFQPAIFYTMFQRQGSVMRSSDEGASWDAFAAGLTTSTSCAAFDSTFHFHVHPTAANTLLASCKSLYLAQNAAPPGNWNPVFTPAEGLVVRSAVDSARNIYYAGTRADSSDNGAGDVYAGVNVANWQRIFQHPQAMPVSDMEVDPAHPEFVYVSFAPGPKVDRNCTNGNGRANGTGEGRIYQLVRPSGPVRGGTTSVDMTSNLLTGLPLDICVNAIAVDPVLTRTVYAGTSKGVYRGRGPANGTSGPWTWAPYADGMPFGGPDVRDLEVHPTTRHMTAATFGRGAFEVILHGLQRAF